MDHFHRHGMTTYSPPIVGVGPHSGDPHYEPSPGPGRHDRHGRLRADRPLVQARPAARRLQRPDPRGLRRRDGSREIRGASSRSSPGPATRRSPACATPTPPAGRCAGWEVDDACRKVIVEAGYGPYFIHRTGHNIGQEVHGNGANMDNLETHEERLVLPPHLLLGRAGHLPVRVRRAQRGQRLRRRRRQGPRHRRTAAEGRADPQPNSGRTR